MKILLIDVYHYNKGGAETVCFNTGKILEQNGHQVIYFTLKWDNNRHSVYSTYFPESKDTRKGVFKNLTNLIYYFYNIEAAKNIERLIIDEKPQIAHIHLLWGQISPSILPILKKHKIPIIYTAHDYRLICPAYTFRNGKGKICEKCKGYIFYKCFTNNCCKKEIIKSAIMAMEQYFRNYFFHPLKYIDGIIFVSRFSYNIHIKYMPKIALKPNAILSNFAPSISPKACINNKNKYYLYFGRLSYEKGLTTLLKSFKHIRNSKLKIAGSGPLQEELELFIKNNSIKNIEFIGYKQGQELINLISNAYFVIVPSEWYENNPMSIIESYSLSTPVIGARIGGIPELINENETGYLFTSGDIEDLNRKIQLANSLSIKEYRKLRINTLLYANENLNEKAYYPKLINFYKSIFKKYKQILK